MNNKTWKIKIETIIAALRKDAEGWEELLSLFNPDTRFRKRANRYEEFKRLGLHVRFQVDDDLYLPGWIGLDQMMINVTTPGFKKKGVSIKENKLEYLEKLWLFSTKDADKKTKLDLDHRRTREIEERRKAGDKIVAGAFIVIAFLIVAFVFKSCADSIDEAKNYDHPACKKLGLKSNWNNTECY
jgi:hypothetical protein